MKFPFFFLLINMMAACNNSNDNVGKYGGPETPDSSTTLAADLTGCYRKVLQRDTVLLQLQQTGDSVSGAMHFDNYQKDSSKGTIKGSVKKDTVIVWYDFFSEGMHSVMEIVLLKTENGLVRAAGPMETKGDSALFQNHRQLEFDPQQTLRRIDCGN
ncbi:MAG TPA: hypothetical protein VFS22_03350 [Flavisolibacter sp.]|nr:hypothetical protein [Flavisolibacter sp.]